MNEVSYSQIEVERQQHLKNIELGVAVQNLKNNPDYQKVTKYLFEELLPDISQRWANSNQDEVLQARMRSLLLMKMELESLISVAIQSKYDLKSLEDFESSNME